MSTSKAFAAMQALATQLRARAGLTGVEVRTAHPGAKLPTEAIVMLSFDGDQRWAALGKGSREETFLIPTSIYVSKPGATETVAKACQDRVVALFAEVENQLRTDPSINSTVRVGAIRNPVAEQGYGDRDRWCEVMFQVECNVRI